MVVKRPKPRPPQFLGSFVARRTELYLTIEQVTF